MNDDIWAPMVFLGSFQKAPEFPSEDPRREVWQRILRLSTHELADRLLLQFGSKAEALRSYFQVRLQQALEFREAGLGRTILSSPLMFYYSFLNLARALVALKSGEEAASSHGLKFNPSSDKCDLFASSATICKKGTFSDFLKVAGYAPTADRAVSLREALTAIPELFLSQSSVVGVPRVAKVLVQAYMEDPGGINLHFKVPGVSDDAFRNRWTTMFPSLVQVAQLGTQGPILTVTAKVCRDYWSVSQFCHQNLLHDLVQRQDPIWYAMREDETTALHRSAYYLIGTFILSNFVRYEPNGFVELVREGSDAAWLLDRFMEKAERFFPQLAYSIAIGRPVYF